MGSFLNFLSPALTVGTQAAAAHQEGKRLGEKDAEAKTLRKLAEMRQAALDEQNKALADAQMANYKSLDADRARETFGDFEQVIKDGKPMFVQRGNRGTNRETPYAPMPKEVPDKLQVVDGQVVDVGAATAKPIQGFVRPPKELTPAQVAQQEARRQLAEGRLAQRYQANPLVKNAYGIANALGPATVALQENTPLGDLMALYAIVKLYDPESVVREGEIKLAQSANSLPDAVRLMYMNTTKGRKITPYYRQQIEGMVSAMRTQKEQQIAPVQRQYDADARRIDANSASVAPSPFEGVGARPNKYRSP